MKSHSKLLKFILSLLLFNGTAFADAFRVGVVIPLTGGLAEFGNAAKNGITLAQEEFPDLFGKVEFLYEDDRYEAKEALSVYQKLTTFNNVDLFYLWGIAPSDAVGPVAEAQKKPMMAVTCRRDVGKDKKYVIRFCYQGQEGGKRLLEYLRAQGYKKFGMVKVELAFINTIIEGIEENLRADESLEIVDTYLFADNDFRTSIAKLKKKKFDAVGVFLGSGQISKFYQQSAALDFRPKTFGTDFFDSLSEVKEAQGGMSEAVFPAPATAHDFAERYRKRFGNDFQIPWAANSYDFAIMLGKHVAAGDGKLSPDEILERIKGIQPFRGASNQVIFHESAKLGAGFDFPVAMKAIKGDRIIEME